MLLQLFYIRPVNSTTKFKDCLSLTKQPVCLEWLLKLRDCGDETIFKFPTSFFKLFEQSATGIHRSL